MNEPEYREVIRNLMLACNELMAEFVSKKRAADWALINDAMVAGEKSIRPASLDLRMKASAK